MTTTDGWDPARYEQFAAERRRPFVDLLELCRPVPGGEVADLGCGTGDLTVELHKALRAAHTVGVDNSPAMLATARERHAGAGGVTFEEGDLAEFAGLGLSLVFANASLHWVDDHAALLGRLRGSLGAGGQLAFQVPANFTHPSHTVATEVAAESRFAPTLADEPALHRGRQVLSLDGYAECLYALGSTEQRVRREVYGHVLDSTASVVEWVQGTLLTPIRRRLDDGAYEAFVTTYRERLLEVLGDESPYFYPFHRILCWAVFD
ncbi:MAG TPA: methyltransferase domain-containing protein [Acidimicrobiales bacterium]|nr:methyltransferase domain-containing protein [Acidimicrobiales bacterium]